MTTVVSIPAATEQISYSDLYARWERGNWCATEIDLSQDRVDWEQKLTPEQRRGALWLYTLFFHGEDSVADNLSPYIDAAPLAEQKYFLATQQVDEARHSVLFHRFMHEVVGRGDGTVTGSLADTESQLTWGHRQVFGRLDRMARELRRDRSARKLASAITLYHIIIEGTLAQPGQHLIEQSLQALDVMPGFRKGMRNVALDEQRHIAFGVRLLADLYREDPDGIQDAIVETIREVLGWTTAVGVPPGWDRSYTEVFGFSVEDLYEEGARAQEARLRAIGLPLDDIANFPLPLELAPRERAERGITLLQAGFIGEKTGPPVRDAQSTAILFDQLRRSVRSDRAPAGTTILWDFTDSEPWHLHLDNGSTSATPGATPDPSIRLRLSFEDFVDLAAGRVAAPRLLVKGRLRVKGDPRMLARLPRLFG